MTKRKVKRWKLMPLIEDDSIKSRILVAALKLFARRGLNDVSLRTISMESGSRNTAAAQYYFGDKKGLIEGILSRVQDRVWQPAEESLKDAVLRDADLREILIRGLWPAKMSVYEYDLGAEASLLLLYCAFDPDPAIREIGEGCTGGHLWSFYRAVRRLLPALPDEIFNQRWQFFVTEALMGQAARVQSFHLNHRLDEYPSPEAHAAYIKALLDFAEGGFKAPVSDSEETALTTSTAFSRE